MKNTMKNGIRVSFNLKYLYLNYNINFQVESRPKTGGVNRINNEITLKFNKSTIFDANSKTPDLSEENRKF